jgi:hypothetical protein
MAEVESRDYVLAEVAMEGERVVLAPVGERRDAQITRCADPDLDDLELARSVLRAHLAERIHEARCS